MMIEVVFGAAVDEAYDSVDGGVQPPFRIDSGVVIRRYWLQVPQVRVWFEVRTNG